jgi:hypothetical protein
MLKVTRGAAKGSAEKLVVEGALFGDWVHCLERECDALLASGRPLVLDLREVRVADHAGLVFLRRLPAHQVRIEASPLLEELVREMDAAS